MMGGGPVYNFRYTSVGGYGVSEVERGSKSLTFEEQLFAYSQNSRRLNLWAALLHLVQGIIVFALVMMYRERTPVRGVFPTIQQIPVWTAYNASVPKDPSRETFESMTGNYTVGLKVQRSDQSLDVRYAIMSFFLLSAAFQGAAAWAPRPFGFEQWSERLRYFEYSISASVMILCIGIESGVVDRHTLMGMFALTFATMIFGLLSDMLADVSLAEGALQQLVAGDAVWGVLGHWTWVIPHLAGWVTCIVGYAPILDTYLQAVATSSLKAPDFVNVIVFLEFALFMCFGLVQTWALVWRTVWFQDDFWVRTRSTRAFIVLSFVAKTLLAWLVLSPIIVSYNRA